MNKDDLVLHQVHWAKLTADVAASVASLALIWKGRRKLGLTIHFCIPVFASAVLMGADNTCLSPRKRSGWPETR